MRLHQYNSMMRYKHILNLISPCLDLDFRFQTSESGSGPHFVVQILNFRLCFQDVGVQRPKTDENYLRKLSFNPLLASFLQSVYGIQPSTSQIFLVCFWRKVRIKDTCTRYPRTQPQALIRKPKRNPDINIYAANEKRQNCVSIKCSACVVSKLLEIGNGLFSWSASLCYFFYTFFAKLQFVLSSSYIIYCDGLIRSYVAQNKL